MSRGTVLSTDASNPNLNNFFPLRSRISSPGLVVQHYSRSRRAALFNKIILFALQSVAYRFKRCWAARSINHRVLFLFSLFIYLFIFNSTRQSHWSPNTSITLALLSERLNRLTRRRGHGRHRCAFKRDLGDRILQNLSLITRHHNL